MKRREFIGLAAGGAAAWSFGAGAQQSLPIVGFLNSGSVEGSSTRTAAFRRGLGETGYTEGQNVAIENRWAEGHYDRLPALVADLVHHQVAVIAATGTSAPGLAAKAATATIPIVFQTGGDPVADGLVTAMNRPNGNVTGVTRLSIELAPKRLELLRELVPKATTIAFLVDPMDPAGQSQILEMQAPARALGVELRIFEASTLTELQTVFSTAAQQGVGALLISNEPAFTVWHQQIAAAAIQHAVPTMVSSRDYVASGILVSYDASITDSYHQVGVYVGRILKGSKPQDLPIEQPTKYELVINLKTAKALGLTVPQTLLVAADEVIE